MSPNLTLSTDYLRQLSYSELKKLAKQKGVKGNLKAAKIISILSKHDCDFTPNKSTTEVNSDPSTSDKTESTIAETLQSSSDQQKLNVTNENIQNKFDKDMMTPLETPRRGTFVVDTPKQTLIFSPEVSSTKSPDENNSTMNMSNINTTRGSTRKTASRKVNFTNLTENPMILANLNNLPKTQSAQRVSNTKQVLFTSPANSKKKNSPVLYRTTPHPKTKKSALGSVGKSRTPKGQQGSKTDSIKKFSKNLSANFKAKNTPNFKKIHEKAFNKMESIDDYQKRKLELSSKKNNQFKTAAVKVKSKIPVPSVGKGVPFIPFTSKNMTFESMVLKDMKKNNEVKENKNNFKRKFDLKASLSRKLNYKPYSGPVKPLSESNLPDSAKCCTHKPKRPMRKVVEENRSKTRDVLKGVRTNKRFELQMKNRMI